MTERYFYQTDATEPFVQDKPYSTHADRMPKYWICDWRKGTARSAALALCFDSEVAERLVGLLNISEEDRLREEGWRREDEASIGATLAQVLAEEAHAMTRRPAAQEDGLDT